MTQEQTSRHHAENERIRRQVDAEIAFGRELERHGMDYAKVKRDLHLTTHQLNVMAHYLYGVNDEEPPATLVGLFDAMRMTINSKPQEPVAA